jgi:ATP-binding cassette subfamily B protein
MTPLRNRIKTTLNLGRALRLVWRTAPSWALVNVGLVFVQGVLPLVALYMMKRIMDGVTNSLTAIDRTTAFQQTGFWILLAGGVALLAVIARLLGEYAAESQSLQVTDAVADILHTQSIAVDLEYYEDSDYYNTLHRAQREAPSRSTSIVNGLIQITQNGISLLGILGLIFSFNWLLALILLFAAVPGGLVRLMYSRHLYGFSQAQTEKERLAWYYHFIITESQNAKELRLFNLGALFKTRYRDLRKQIREGKLVLSRHRVLYDLFAQTVSIIALFGSLAWIALQTVRGAITLGDLVVFYLGFQNGLNFLQAALRSLAGLYEDNLFLTNLYQFLDLKPKIVAPPKPCPVPHSMLNGIMFQNVSFTYSSREQETLHDINLTLAPGEVIALVGKNGSGKTTLIKLLCRLYDPSLGVISVDGVNLRDLDPIQWRREISVVFQDYARYALTVRENIWLGNVETQPDPVRIEQVSRQSGADNMIRHLPQAYDTMLGHWFKDGQELSVGEWQKIALARAFWREAHILILDEPSSSLDPLAEADLFHNFRELLNRRSAILISHRFSTVQMADRIYVMDQGCIVEHGTHLELLAQNGQYASLYHAQAQHYQEQ